MKPILITTAAVLFLSIAAHGQEIDAKATETKVKGTEAPAPYKSSSPEKPATPVLQAAPPEEQKTIVPEPSQPKAPEPVVFQKQPAAVPETKNIDRPKNSTLQPMKKAEAVKTVTAPETSQVKKLE